MASRDDAKRAWEKATENFQEKRPTRIVYVGDGRGMSASNVNVPGRSDYIYVRESLGANRFAQVLNRAAVQPMFNLPVIVGYKDDEPQEEQVLGVHYAGLGQGTPGTSLTTVGPHHVSHQFGGGDEVYIDSRLFLPGLVQPTDPPSMQVRIKTFTYYYNGWKQFSEAASVDLTAYKPGGGDSLFLLIALDPTTDTIVYRQGNSYNPVFTTTSFANMPAPSGDEIPLGAILLKASTGVIDWNSGGTDNIYDARLFVTPVFGKIINRLTQLEGVTGNDPNLPSAGVGGLPTDIIDNTLNGLADVDTNGATNTQALAYQQSTNRWIPQTISAGGASDVHEVRRYAYLLG